MKSQVAASKTLFAILLPLLLITSCSNASGQSATPAPQKPYFTEPTISPDRSEIAFVSAGDVWTVPATGGEARLLVSHPANESRPLFSPDGRRVAFISTRTGNGDIYLLTLDSGDLKRLTFDDSNDQLDAWSADNKWIYFSSNSRDIAGMNDIFRVSADGGTPMQVSADRYTTEYFSAPSPDGSAVAFTGHGFGSAQWWRKGHSHIDESEIWVLRPGSTPKYEQISEGGAKEMWPMWARDGRSIYYVSDRTGTENVWVREPGSKPSEVTHFTGGRVIWPSISYDGRMIVFDRDSQIWRLDTDGGSAIPVPITRRGVAAAPAVEHLRMSDQISEIALSPDGKKTAFIVRGEVFAVATSEGGDGARVTRTPSEESQVAWSPDSRRLVYVSDRDATAHLFLYDFATGAETQLTNGPASDATPRYSPDGKMIAFERGGSEIVVLDLDTRRERAIARAHLQRPPLNADRAYVWSPDSKWIAYMPVGEKLFKNVFVVSAAGGESRAVTFLSNVGSNTVSWSPDGTYLVFDTGQRTETAQLARVDLLPRTPRFREDQFRDLFKEDPPRILTTTLKQPQSPEPQVSPSPSPIPTPEASPTPASPNEAKPKPTPKPVEISFDQVRQRLSLLPVGIDVRYQTISPDGKWVLMIAAVANQLNLYLFPLDELSKEPFVAKQLTSTAGNKSYAQFSPDGKEIHYLEQGRINIITVETRQTRPLAVTAEMDVDFAREKLEVFRQAWTYLNDNFYDTKFHGANWKEVHGRFAPLALAAQTPDELRRIISLMVGELNASHLGISAPQGSAQPPATGRLGLRFDRDEYEKQGALRITEVVPLSPAALAKLKPGDYLTAVNGTTITARTNLDQLLAHQINRRVVLTVAASAGGSTSREAVLRPVNPGTEKGLVYRNWVEENRAYVARISNGRLGYVHMPDMSFGALAQLYVDLDVENQKFEGVVIDMRNNNGGFVNVYAIDVFARRSYFTMTPRGFSTSPSRTVLGQRALESPTILVINRHTLSDGEDFTEGYRFLRLGKVVGEPTAGWIIYTSGVQLIDGSVLRLPFSRITATDGTVMEMNPRPVDVPVDKPVGESYLKRDSQLEVAVTELLKQLGSRK
ncbi:MAG: LpqB family beta-propeller domain-containing protein [Acidobacteriota bacterium]